MRTRIKVCGITQLHDVHNAVACGVDALGFVFVPSSPRYLSVEQGAKLVVSLPPFVAAVGLFMNNSEADVRAVLSKMRLDLLQFHGDEPADFCTQFGMPYIKAVPMGGNLDLEAYIAEHADAKAFLLDSHAPGESGGSGLSFDWENIPEVFNKPVILAGGLKPDNVAQAIIQARPYAVDVSSGVEVSKGVKSLDKMIAFAEAVQKGDSKNAKQD